MFCEGLRGLSENTQKKCFIKTDAKMIVVTLEEMQMGELADMRAALIHKFGLYERQEESHQKFLTMSGTQQVQEMQWQHHAVGKASSARIWKLLKVCFCFFFPQEKHVIDSNYSIHTATNQSREKDNGALEWPSQSPDLKSLRNLCQNLKK